MTRLFLAFLSWFGAFFRSRHDLGLELVALRQQVGVLKRKNPRPKLSRWDRLFWLGLRRWWSKWASVLVVVKPETVVGWYRTGFRCYRRFLSRRCPGRPKITTELCHLIRSMAAENPNLGSSSHPRRALEIGIRNLRVHRLPLPGARDLGSRLRPALAYLSQEPSRGHHRHGLFHRAHRDVPGALLLLCDQPRPPPNRALQRHRASHLCLDRAATARGFPGRSCTPVI